MLVFNSEKINSVHSTDLDKNINSCSMGCHGNMGCWCHSQPYGWAGLSLGYNRAVSTRSESLRCRPHCLGRQYFSPYLTGAPELENSSSEEQLVGVALLQWEPCLVFVVGFFFKSISSFIDSRSTEANGPASGDICITYICYTYTHKGIETEEEKKQDGVGWPRWLSHMSVMDDHYWSKKKAWLLLSRPARMGKYSTHANRLLDVPICRSSVT